MKTLSFGAGKGAVKPPLVKMEPTFLLKGVNSKEITLKYINGDYQKLYIPGQKVTKSNRSVTLAQEYGDSNKAPIYTFRDKSNTKKVIATTNQSNPADKKIPFNCDWCRNLIKDQIIGIPVRMKYDFNTKIYTYELDDTTCCSFECAYAVLISLGKVNRCYSDPIYSDSEQLLLNFYHKLYPNEKLIPSKHWKLRQANNGSLTDNEYYSKAHLYHQTNNIIVHHSRREYQQVVTSLYN